MYKKYVSLPYSIPCDTIWLWIIATEFTLVQPKLRLSTFLIRYHDLTSLKYRLQIKFEWEYGVIPRVPISYCIGNMECVTPKLHLKLNRLLRYFQKYLFPKILRVIKFSSHPMKFFPKPSNYRFSIEQTSFTIFSIFPRYSFSKFTNTDNRDPPIDRSNVISLKSGWFQISKIFYTLDPYNKNLFLRNFQCFFN